MPPRLGARARTRSAHGDRCASRGKPPAAAAAARDGHMARWICALWRAGSGSLMRAYSRCGGVPGTVNWARHGMYRRSIEAGASASIERVRQWIYGPRYMRRRSSQAGKGGANGVSPRAEERNAACCAGAGARHHCAEQRSEMARGRLLTLDHRNKGWKRDAACCCELTECSPRRPGAAERPSRCPAACVHAVPKGGKVGAQGSCVRPRAAP
jgi:hypothetical protein